MHQKPRPIPHPLNPNQIKLNQTKPNQTKPNNKNQPMLALSPPTNPAAADQKDGLSDPFLSDDFLNNIDFTSIFDSSSDLFPNPLPLPQHVDHSNIPHTNKLDQVIKHSHGKKKVKVDWTPDLHRRFVQAVEELGVEKAVPSRILEIMGIHNLTRHNVASHLQKYRSHRKHLLGREAEATSWSIIKKENNGTTWNIGPTTIGFVPPTNTIHTQFIRPLHVWGHPTLNRPQMLYSMWPNQTHPPNYIAYCHPHYQRGGAEGWGPSAVISGPHFMTHPFPVMRFAHPPVAGVPPHPMYRTQHWVSQMNKHSNLQPQLHDYPSKESIDAAIGDVLAKPWLPLPLGLKPPSTESVLVELQRQGVSKVPPAYNPQGN